MSFDPNNLSTFGPQPAEPSILRDYILQVANQPALLQSKRNFQFGGKKGEPLYTHLLNGVMLLHALKKPLQLTDEETRLLMTVFTIHDINKDPAFTGNAFAKIAIPENFATQIERFNLASFFPQAEKHLPAIVKLARDHGGHSGQFASLGAFPTAGLDANRLRQLLSLIQAVDIIDLSHTLTERTHKATFLSAINRFATNTQYRFYSHQLSENRGSFSNLIHAAIVETLEDTGAYPLLYYPDGVVYLIEQTETIQLTADQQQEMAHRCTQMVNRMTQENLAEFIGKDQKQGIKVDPKVLELVSDFATIWAVIDGKVQAKKYDPIALGRKIATKTAKTIAKLQQAHPETAAQVTALLEEPDTLLPASEPLRLGELIRSFYIFLNDHFSLKGVDHWETIYDLLDIPADTRDLLSFFEARYNRPYVLMRDFPLSYDDVYTRLQAYGQEKLGSLSQQDERSPIFLEYLGRYALFGPFGQTQAWGTGRFSDHLHHYIKHQHKQCAQCSTIFSTAKWMANDVRTDVTVQTFSNRLRGGPGEPKKYICQLCQMQFLVEQLNYEEVRSEKTLYLHFFPYSFLPMPYIAALQDSLEQIRGKDTAVRALWCNTRTAIQQEQAVNPDFLTRTKKDQPHSFGIYLPRVRNTIGNRIIFPINSPNNDNDTQRFLFALWYAIVLQEHLGLKVMLTEAPNAPFTPSADLYIDNIPVSCRGFLPQNDFNTFIDYEKDSIGRLQILRHQARALHRIQQGVLTTGKRDEILDLVRAISRGGLHVLYTAEKLLEAKIRDRNLNNPEWAEIRLSQQLLPDLTNLIHHIGDKFMTQMSHHLQQLAEIAWQSGLRGKSLKKNSLMTSLDEILKKLGQRSQAFDTAALKAVICEDIFAYLDRIADDTYKPDKKKQQAITQFVDLFFTDIYKGLYQESLTKLLADEKMLRSAFIFYVRQQIPNKKESGEAEG